MKYSRQRNIILDIMKNTYQHPTAEEVYEEAKKVLPEIGIATIYRNLNQLVEIGSIKRISLGNGNDRYDGHLEEHYHLICKCCGRLQDIRPKKEKLAMLKEAAREAVNLKDENMASLNTATLEGICDNCIEKDMVVNG